MLRSARFRGKFRYCFSSPIVTADLDILRTANLLVKQHGQDAPIEAAGLFLPANGHAAGREGGTHRHRPQASLKSNPPIGRLRLTEAILPRPGG